MNLSNFKQPIADEPPHSRDAKSARVVPKHCPSIEEGAGNAGRSSRTRSLACKRKKHASKVTTGKPRQPALPAQWSYGLFRALPGEPGFVATITCEIIARRLDISVGISGPRGFAVRYPLHSSGTAKASIASRIQHS